jgi:hypothetical protein
LGNWRNRGHFAMMQPASQAVRKKLTQLHVVGQNKS